MAKYRKKPVVIEAIQFTGDNPKELVAFTGMNLMGDMQGNIYIPTLEGQHIASPGDFIIKGVQGELYPCKPDIFKQTYEKVGE